MHTNYGSMNIRGLYDILKGVHEAKVDSECKVGVYEFQGGAIRGTV